MFSTQLGNIIILKRLGFGNPAKLLNQMHMIFDAIPLLIGKVVTEDSMYEILVKSGVQAADWLKIAKQLELTIHKQAAVFLKAWKDSDTTGPTWSKLANALAAIRDGVDWYERASKEAKKNAGMHVT